MNKEIELDDKNLMVMKLLHYFITEKNYNPIILQGVENEIWLENLNADYEIIRIVSNHIHNDEQYDFDAFKTKRIVKKIKRKTFSFNMNVFSFFLDLGESVTKDFSSDKGFSGVKISNEKDLDKTKEITKYFPDLLKKMDYKENGFELFMKITNDINEHNKKDSKKVEDIFKMKFPIITYILIGICVLLYVGPMLESYEFYKSLLQNFGVYAPAIKNGEYYRLLTGIFLHGSLIHLLVNCYSLYIVGSQIESYLGKIKYLLIFIISGLVGSLLSVVFTKNAISIGASGAIFGLMGSLLYFGYHYRVFLGNFVKRQLIPLIIINLLIGFSSSGIDNFAHIGGLIGGILSTMALGVTDKSSTSEKVNGWIILTLFTGFLIYLGFIYLA